MALPVNSFGSSGGADGTRVAAALAAIDREDVETLSMLLETDPSFPIDESASWRDDMRLAPIHLAARQAALRSIQVLLVRGASATVHDGQGWSCLHHLATSSADDESKALALTLLLRAGADADASTPTHQTALHLASREASTGPDFLSRLVLVTRETNACDAAGRTALHYTALSTVNDGRALELAEVLLKYANIDPRDADSEGRSAAEVAEARGKAELAAGLRRAEERAAARASCCCGGGRWVQPAILIGFVLLTHAMASFYCLPCIEHAGVTIGLATLLVLVAVSGVATSASNPGYLPRNSPSLRQRQRQQRQQQQRQRQQHDQRQQQQQQAAAASAQRQPSRPEQQPAAGVAGVAGVQPRLTAGPLVAPPPTGAAEEEPQAPLAFSNAPIPQAITPLGHTGSVHYCHSCRAPKPLRSKHCRTCDRCVAQFDHHCPWLGACIGLRNRVQFYLFVSALVLDLWALLALGALSAYDCSLDGDDANAADMGALAWNAMTQALAPGGGAELNDANGSLEPLGLKQARGWPLEEEVGSGGMPSPPSPASWVCANFPTWCAALPGWRVHTAVGMRIALAGLAGLVALPLTYFWYCRTRNVLVNLTTNERHNKSRYAHFRRSDGSFFNPFDRGPLANCKHYFCRGAAVGQQLLLFQDDEPRIGWMAAVKPIV